MTQVIYDTQYTFIYSKPLEVSKVSRQKLNIFETIGKKILKDDSSI